MSFLEVYLFQRQKNILLIFITGFPQQTFPPLCLLLTQRVPKTKHLLIQQDLPITLFSDWNPVEVPTEMGRIEATPNQFPSYRGFFISEGKKELSFQLGFKLAGAVLAGFQLGFKLAVLFNITLCIFLCWKNIFNSTCPLKTCIFKRATIGLSFSLHF